jgi:aryl-alcohol dehydrogenase-like predicted oxidoreductase
MLRIARRRRSELNMPGNERWHVDLVLRAWAPQPGSIDVTQLRQLGGSGFSVAPLVLGGNVFGWTADRNASFAVLDRFVDAGGTMVDTADTYSVYVPGHVGGESESIIGEWAHARKSGYRVQLATKVGMRMPDGAGLGREWIVAEVEASLRRLRRDWIDLYYAHCDDEFVPQEETQEAFDQLVRAGKVRALGASNLTPSRLASAINISNRLGFAHYTVFQPCFNLIDQNRFPPDFRDYCRLNNLGVVSYWALASGFLTGKYRSRDDVAGTPRSSRLRGYMDDASLKLVSLLRDIAAETGTTPAQLALAWIMAQPGITAPIASATTAEQADELTAAMGLCLDREVLARLDEGARELAISRVSDQPPTANLRRV